MAEQLQTINQTQTTIPDYAKPYVEDLLGQAQAYTDPNARPYMQYMGDRVAQFTPLQQQAYENAGLMQTSGQLQDATALAGQAGMGALNTQYTYKPSNFDTATAKSMMSPYMDNVVARQQQDATRQAQIAGQAQQAQAQQQKAQQQMQDPIVQMQQQELALKAQEVELKQKKLEIDAATQADKLDIERERIEAQKEIAGMQVGAKSAKDRADLEARQEEAGIRMGIDVAKSHTQLQQQLRAKQPPTKE